MNKLPIVVRRTLGLMLQQKPPNVGGHQFTKDECKKWYLNPFITKAVLSHLVSFKEGEDDTDIMLRQMSLVTVTFDPTSEESVMMTVMSSYTHLAPEHLPVLAQSQEFQMKQIEQLNEKLRKALVTKNKYDQFNIKMMEFKKDLKLVDDWIEAFSHVGSTLVRDDSKAAFWAQPNSNSSNSQGDRPRRNNE